MKAALVALALLAGQAPAQEQIFRCGDNTYTNNAEDAKTRGCKAVTGQAGQPRGTAGFVNFDDPSPPPKRELGPIDRWRFESCQTDAAKAPTQAGVYQGLRVCREKFGQ